MNRRNFFKVVTGFVAGIFAGSVEGKKRSGTRYISPSSSPTSTTMTSTSSNCIHICCVTDLNDEKLVCYGKNGTLCPRCKFNCKSTAIDPNSEWAKQKPLYILKSGPPGPTEIPNKSCILYRNWEYLFDVEDRKGLTVIHLTIGRRTVSRMEDKEIFWTNDIVRKGILDNMILELEKV